MFLFQSKHNRIAILSTLILVIILIISIAVFFSTLKIGSNQPVLPFTINYRVQQILPQNQLPIQESLYTSEHYPVAFTIALIFTVTLMVFIQWRRKRATVKLLSEV